MLHPPETVSEGGEGGGRDSCCCGKPSAVQPANHAAVSRSNGASQRRWAGRGRLAARLEPGLRLASTLGGDAVSIERARAFCKQSQRVRISPRRGALAKNSELQPCNPWHPLQLLVLTVICHQKSQHQQQLARWAHREPGQGHKRGVNTPTRLPARLGPRDHARRREVLGHC